jgi:hypothetical protein
MEGYKTKVAKSFALIILAFALLCSLNFVSAVEASYCCEKTTSGAWCQNQPQSSCDSGFKMAPTSCDSTSYCKPGCCFDSQEGLCMENTPQRVCEESDGTWDQSKLCEIPQCNLGCCVLGDQGAFVTLTRCKQLSGFYGIETDFKNNIEDELSCVAVAQQEKWGACVYDDPASATKTCKFTLRKNCQTASEGTQVNITQNTSATASVGFYEDILCTAEELGTDCAPSTKTMTVPGKDGIYWKDTCGNQANIYDATKYTDDNYWKNVYSKEESCGSGSSNAGSSSCGNCDYYLGSIAQTANSETGYPTYGDYICIDLNCEEYGKKHGESWCASDSPTGNGLDPVGSRYFKEVCIFGELIVEPCAEYRNERCVEGNFGSFSEAACRANRWQDCTAQVEDGDCNNYDQRDCHWIEGYYFSTANSQIEKSNNDSTKGALTPTGLCMPNYPPGFNFWGASDASASGTPGFNSTTPAFGSGAVATSSGEASGLCSLGNAKVAFKWERTTRPAQMKNAKHT